MQWVLIGLVSSFDVYLSVKLRDVLHHEEWNPLGRFLLQMDNDDVALFMGVKVAGTIAALGILVLLYDWNKKWGHTIVAAISFFQASLLIYMLNF